jgi:hypothetical protein
MKLRSSRIIGISFIAALGGDCSGGAPAVAADVPAQGLPTPRSGDVILWQDSFDKSSLAAAVAPYATRGSVQLVGDDGGGGALRFAYSGGSFDNLIERQFETTGDIFFQFRYRTSPGADPSCRGQNDSGIKWFMAWRPGDAPRYTMSATNADGVPYQGRPNAGLEFTSHDNSSTKQPAQMLSNIDHTVRLSTTNEGGWHHYTLHIRTGSGGYEQIWVDSVRVLDSFGLGYDHDPTGISLIQLPGTMVRWFAGCDFYIDVDDLVVWRR